MRRSGTVLALSLATVTLLATSAGAGARDVVATADTRQDVAAVVAMDEAQFELVQEVIAADAQLAAKVAVTARLLSLGLTPDEALVRVNALSEDDLQQLAARPEQLAMGAIEDKTLLIIAVILVVPSLLLLLAV